MDYNNNTTEVQDTGSNTNRNIIIGVIALAVIIGIGMVLGASSSGTVAGVNTSVPNVPGESQTTGQVQGTVQNSY